MSVIEEEATVCGACGGRIVWCKTTGGERVAIDADPVEDGDILIRVEPGKLVAMVLGPGDIPKDGQERHRRHVDGCRYLQRGWDIERATSEFPDAASLDRMRESFSGG